MRDAFCIFRIDFRKVCAEITRGHVILFLRINNSDIEYFSISHYIVNLQVIYLNNTKSKLVKNHPGVTDVEKKKCNSYINLCDRRKYNVTRYVID